MRKTKIVTTLGPSTATKEGVSELLRLGVDVFRLNFSHGDHASHEETIHLIRECFEETGLDAAILQDISGPKIRIGEVDGILQLKRGENIRLSKIESEDVRTFTLTYPEIIDSVQEGEEIYFADGTVRTFVKEKSADTLTLELLTDGKLSSRKGVNFPNTKLNVPVITPKDEKDLVFGAKMGVDIVALSFVQNGADVIRAKEILASVNSDPFIVSKIETNFAIDNLDSILAESDGVMVARGDLGAELGVHRVPNLQKRIIHKANALGKPVITATQMLMSMVQSPYPTRAEVSDVANAVFDGTDAVMLSDETTIGDFPFKAVEVLNETIAEAEKNYDFDKNYAPSQDDAIAKSAVWLLESTDSDAIVSFTTSGLTARNVSKYRPKKKIYAVTHSKKVKTELKLVWGVEPICVVEESNSVSKLINDFIRYGKKHNLITPESKFIITMGYLVGQQGSTNLIRILDSYGIEKIESMYD